MTDLGITDPVNAAGYGFDEAGAAIHLEDFKEMLDRHTRHVDAALRRLFDELHAEYRANRAWVRYDGSSGAASVGEFALQPGARHAPVAHDGRACDVEHVGDLFEFHAGEELEVDDLRLART